MINVKLIKARDVKKGQKFKYIVDRDFTGQPIYNKVYATSDAVVSGDAVFIEVAETLGLFYKTDINSDVEIIND
ncbi:hypothetical protein W70_47 [Escherichia phage W70]|nr:hypothetical protein W70_47 [Escherichia phage W70]